MSLQSLPSGRGNAQNKVIHFSCTLYLLFICLLYLSHLNFSHRIMPLGSNRRKMRVTLFLGVCVCASCRFCSINNVAIVLFPQICGQYKYWSIICSLEFKLLLQIVISNMKSYPAFGLKMYRQKLLCLGTPAEGRPQLDCSYFTYLHLKHMTLKMFPFIV